jgi:cytochrome c oxidase assembly factor CtaG
MGFFAIPTAVAGFFLSAFIAMIFWGIIAPDFEVKTIGYPMAMLITIGVWLIIAPLAAAIARKSKWG